jgi:microcystin-dependent protein
MDGSGHPDHGVPDMRGALGYFQNLQQGRAFLVQVPGVNNAGLDDAQITRLTNWTMKRFSSATLPPGWKPYTEEEIRAYRAQRPTEVAATRARIVQELRAMGVQLATSNPKN